MAPNTAQLQGCQRMRARHLLCLQGRASIHWMQPARLWSPRLDQKWEVRGCYAQQNGTLPQVCLQHMAKPAGPPGSPASAASSPLAAMAVEPPLLLAMAAPCWGTELSSVRMGTFRHLSVVLNSSHCRAPPPSSLLVLSSTRFTLPASEPIQAVPSSSVSMTLQHSPDRLGRRAGGDTLM